VGELRFAAIVLAAGKSKRMGTNKLLLEVKGRTVLDRLLDALDESIVDDIYVVLGHRTEELEQIVQTHRAQQVINPDYKEGMTSSFRAGLSEVSADATFLILADQLGLEPDLIESMALRMESDPEMMIVSPVHEDKRGHPVLFRRPLFPEILEMGREENLKDLVDRHDDAHKFVEGDLWCTLDMDTPDEFERVKKLFEEVPDN
jgi:molybdenum cofactor cytidylyltransferase